MNYAVVAVLLLFCSGCSSLDYSRTLNGLTVSQDQDLFFTSFKGESWKIDLYRNKLVPLGLKNRQSFSVDQKSGIMAGVFTTELDRKFAEEIKATGSLWEFHSGLSVWSENRPILTVDEGREINCPRLISDNYIVFSQSNSDLNLSLKQLNRTILPLGDNIILVALKDGKRTEVTSGVGQGTADIEYSEKAKLLYFIRSGNTSSERSLYTYDLTDGSTKRIYSFGSKSRDLLSNQLAMTVDNESGNVVFLERKSIKDFDSYIHYIFIIDRDGRRTDIGTFRYNVRGLLEIFLISKMVEIPGQHKIVFMLRVFGNGQGADTQSGVFSVGLDGRDLERLEFDVDRKLVHHTPIPSE